jgi:hypothetical protein
MPALKGMQRRPRIAARTDLAQAKYQVPVELREAVKVAATASGLSQSMYVEFVLRQLADQSGALPRVSPESRTPEVSHKHAA